MKKLLLLLITSAITSITAQTYQYLGNYTSDGTPLYLEYPSDVVTIETQEMISKSLPEGFPVPDFNPHYITSGYDTDLRIEKNADVWVTFVSEGAGYKNVLGFYTYALDNPISTVPKKEDITIIFPNVSAKDSGGGLQIGDKVKIGTFEAGTGIGWVLLANAWSSASESVGDGLWKLYSNPSFNPESEESYRYHNVLLVDPSNERIILGFEDIRRDNNGCDNDFNDAVFYVTANPYEAINTTNYADVDDATDITSAYDGGLESNGVLANLIAKRNFNRKKEGTSHNKKELQTQFYKNTLSKSINTNSLIDYLPETEIYNASSAKISSPEDLLGITNATEVFSVDYYNGDKRVAAVLATATEGSIYDHSKVICDRLNNSSLEDVRTVVTRNHKIISSKIKRPKGEVEYTLSFSIKLNNTNNELFSFWNIEQYPTGDFQNFQIWGSSFGQVFSIANFIIDKHTFENGLTSKTVENVIPNVFVKSGFYSNGAINLNIINKTKETSVNFVGNFAETEVSGRSNMSNSFSLTGNYNEQLSIETGVLFDIGFSLQTENHTQKDALYLADGPWGLDYLKEFANVNNFEVKVSDREFLNNVYEVDRNANVSGEVKGNINLFRHILPGEQTLDVTNYSFINLKITNNEPVEVVIMQDDDRAWENRIRYTIPVNTDKKAYNIAFNDFKDTAGKSVEITNIKTIVFSIIGDYTNYKSFNIDIKDLSFKTQNVLSVDTFSSFKETKLINFPNPFKRTTTIKVPTSSDYFQIQVVDLLGRIVDFKKIDTDNSMNTIKYNAPNLNKGIYKYSLKDDKNKSHTGTFIIK